MEDPKEEDQSVIPATLDESQEVYSDVPNPLVAVTRRLESRQGVTTLATTARAAFTVSEDEDIQPPVLNASSSEESAASTVIVGQEHRYRMPPGAARATQAAMNVRGIVERHSGDTSESTLSPYPQSTASSGRSESSSSKSSDKSFEQSLQSSVGSLSPQKVPLVSTKTGKRKQEGMTQEIYFSQSMVCYEDTTEQPQMPLDASSHAFLSLQPSQEFQPHIDPSLVDIIPPTPERLSCSLPLPIPSTPSDTRPVSSSVLSVVEKAQTEAEASQEVEIHDIHREWLRKSEAANTAKQPTTEPEEHIFSQELFETPSQQTEEQHRQPAKLSTTPSSSLSTVAESSSNPSFLSPFPGTQLSLDMPSQLRQQLTEGSGSQRESKLEGERRGPYFEMPVPVWKALSVENLEKLYGMPVVQPLLSKSQGPEDQSPKTKEQSDVSEVPETVSKESDNNSKTAHRPEMESSFVLKLTMSQDSLQSQLQEEEEEKEAGQSSVNGDTGTELTSSIVANASQSIIKPLKSMSTDKTGPVTREMSEKQQEEQQQIEEIGESLEAVKDREGTADQQPSASDDNVRPPDTTISAVPAVTTSSLKTTQTPSTRLGLTSGLATEMTTMTTAKATGTAELSVYSFQLSSSPVQQQPIVLPRADIPIHAPVYVF
jgi:hypothetical protein